ncbi:hypothetical protein [Blastomonas sp. CCH1-A6]|jgi:hypothetical protein|uniref:hypothetical protein n=1 Tax=Blastomonas sp. CCH1-A6 TaxID=1768762 RepID=UPI00082C518D
MADDIDDDLAGRDILWTETLPDEPDAPDEIALALIRHLYRRGLFDLDDIEAIAADVPDELAHDVRCAALEADATPHSDWQADRARSRFRIVRNEDET